MWALLHRIITAHRSVSPTPCVDCTLSRGKNIHHPPGCILAPPREPLHRRDSPFPQSLPSSSRVPLALHWSWNSETISPVRAASSECACCSLRPWETLNVGLWHQDGKRWGRHRRKWSWRSRAAILLHGVWDTDAHTTSGPTYCPADQQRALSPPSVALPQPHLGSTYLWSEKTKC